MKEKKNEGWKERRQEGKINPVKERIKLYKGEMNNRNI